MFERKSLMDLDTIYLAFCQWFLHTLFMIVGL